MTVDGGEKGDNEGLRATRQRERGLGRGAGSLSRPVRRARPAHHRRHVHDRRAPDRDRRTAGCRRQGDRPRGRGHRRRSRGTGEGLQAGRPGDHSQRRLGLAASAGAARRGEVSPEQQPVPVGRPGHGRLVLGAGQGRRRRSHPVAHPRRRYGRAGGDGPGHGRDGVHRRRAHGDPVRRDRPGHGHRTGRPHGRGRGGAARCGAHHRSRLPPQYREAGEALRCDGHRRLHARRRARAGHGLDGRAAGRQRLDRQRRAGQRGVRDGHAGREVRRPRRLCLAVLRRRGGHHPDGRLGVRRDGRSS